MAEFVRIGEAGHEWDALCNDWRMQTEALGETFDADYQLQPDIFLPLIARKDAKAGLYANFDDGRYDAVCQLNTTGIPGYTQPVLRVRHVTFSPRIDLSDDQSVEIYAKALTETFFDVVKLAISDGPMKAGHIHFHLPSPADRQFFTFMGQRFKEREFFNKVDLKGAWLYITV